MSNVTAKFVSAGQSWVGYFCEYSANLTISWDIKWHLLVAVSKILWVDLIVALNWIDYFSKFLKLTLILGQSINQSINFICPEINTHWTGHQGRTQPPLTGAHKNKVSKNNKCQLLVQFIAALLSCLFLYCRICVVITVSSTLANYK